jgi:TetR/AcrR family acrAB operon transcriptional repressor
MARRTKEEALATRSHILDTAERLFEAHGVSRTSLHDIAQAAGLTRGAIYWHFDDKADLFNAMMERVTLPMEKALQVSAVPGVDDPVAAIRHNFLEALRKTVSDPQARRVFEIAIHKVEYVGELQAVRARRLAVRNECLAEVERGLKLAMRRGLLSRRMPARMAALGLQAVIEGLIQNWMLDPHAFDLVGAGEQILDSYLAGLAPFGPTSPAPAQRNEKQAAPSQPSVPSKARARRAAVAVSLAQRRVPGPAR